MEYEDSISQEEFNRQSIKLASLIFDKFLEDDYGPRLTTSVIATALIMCLDAWGIDKDEGEEIIENIKRSYLSED